MKKEQKKNEQEALEVDELKKQLAATQAQAEEYLNGWKRAKADLDNFEKRESKAMYENLKYANTNLILEILPVLDNYDRAFAGLTEEENKSGWVQGFKYIQTQLQQILEKNNVKKFNSAGEQFDPLKHEALEKIKGPENQIMEEVVPGYTFHDKIIRHAKVKVGSGK